MPKHGKFWKNKDLHAWMLDIDAALASGTGAPATADYLVKTADASLSAERVVTDTADITWDWATPGQAKANLNPNTLKSFRQE